MPRPKLQITKPELYELYTIQEKSGPEIARIYKCNHKTIYRYLKKFDIKRKTIAQSLRQFPLNKRELYSKYILYDKTIIQIADELTV